MCGCALSVPTALTCLLQAESDDGDYDPSAVQFYNGLRDHFGESFIA